MARLTRTVLRRMDEEDYEDKIKRWGGENPVPSNCRIKNTTIFSADDVELDAEGNIIKMPQLDRKPCFGIATAFLRHGRAKHVFVPTMRKLVASSRCDVCKVRSACIKVVTTRMRYISHNHAGFKEALLNWSIHKGFEEEGFHLAYKDLSEKGWRDLYAPMQRFNFTSVNDNYIREYWENYEEKQSAKDKIAERKRTKERWQENASDRDLIQGLDAGMEERRKLLLEAVLSADSPSYIKNIPIESVPRICNAWWGHELAKLTGRKINNSSIATIIRNARRHDGKSANVLRDSVKRDLVRVRRLESNAKYNSNVPVWPKFRHPALG